MTDPDIVNPDLPVLIRKAGASREVLGVAVRLHNRDDLCSYHFGVGDLKWIPKLEYVEERITWPEYKTYAALGFPVWEMVQVNTYCTANEPSKGDVVRQIIYAPPTGG